MSFEKFIKENAAFNDRTDSRAFLANNFDTVNCRYYADGKHYDAHIRAAFNEDPDVHLILLDDQLILEIDDLVLNSKKG